MDAISELWKKNNEQFGTNERLQSLNSINNNVPFYDDEQFKQEKCTLAQSMYYETSKLVMQQFNKTATR